MKYYITVSFDVLIEADNPIKAGEIIGEELDLPESYVPDTLTVTRAIKEKQNAFPNNPNNR